MRMGICSVITSDQGSEFNNSLNRELMALLKIDYRLTTPYHPQVFFKPFLKLVLILFYAIYLGQWSDREV